VVPIYHRGMDEIVPEKVLTGKARLKKPSFPPTVVPWRGKLVQMYVGEALDFTQELAAFRAAHPGMLDHWSSTPETLDLYVKITETIRQAVLKQEALAWGRAYEVPKKAEK